MILRKLRRRSGMRITSRFRMLRRSRRKLCRLLWLSWMTMASINKAKWARRTVHILKLNLATWAPRLRTTIETRQISKAAQSVPTAKPKPVSNSTPVNKASTRKVSAQSSWLPTSKSKKMSSSILKRQRLMIGMRGKILVRWASVRIIWWKVIYSTSYWETKHSKYLLTNTEAKMARSRLTSLKVTAQLIYKHLA